MARSSLTNVNSQAAMDWAERKRQALEHAKALRAAREAESVPEPEPQQQRRRPSPVSADPMDALDQYMNGEARNMVSSPRRDDYSQDYRRDEYSDEPTPCSGDAIEDFMGGPVPDILGGLEHIGAKGRGSPPVRMQSRPPSQVAAAPAAAPVAADTSLARQNSLSLLKKRNPNATRRPRAPKVPGELLESAKCGCCGQLVSQCVDCNYCHAVFCREHFEDSVMETGRCPSCSHRASSYDCNENFAVQRMVDIMKRLLSEESDSPPQEQPRQPQPQQQPQQQQQRRQQPAARRPSRDSTQKASSGFGALVGDHELQEPEPAPEQFSKPAGVRRKPRQTPVRREEEPPKKAPEPSWAAEEPAWEKEPPVPPARRSPPAARSPAPAAAPAAAPWDMANAYPPEADGPTEQPTAAVPMHPCSGCGRKFKLDTLAKHEPKCVDKANKPKRKVFNAKAQILAGTGAEKYVDKSGPITGKSQHQKAEDRPLHGKPVPKWKRQSEELKKAMRAEREYKAAVKQGKPPPPPPVSHEPDPSLVPCPHCGRTFSEQAAERHIPKCSSQVAKPKMLMRGAGNAGGKNAAMARRGAKGTMRL